MPDFIEYRIDTLTLHTRTHLREFFIPKLDEDRIIDLGYYFLPVGFMGEHEGYRYQSRIGDEKECEDGIAQDILEARTPALGEHLLKYRYESSCDDRSEFWMRIIEHVEPYRIFLVGRIKEYDIIGSRLWDIREDGLDEITMRIDHSDSSTIEDIGIYHILEESRLSHTSLSYDIDVTSSIYRLEPEVLCLSTIVRHTDRSIRIRGTR